MEMTMNHRLMTFLLTATVALVFGCSSSDGVPPETEKPVVNTEKPQPAAPPQRQIKRDWRGITLGSARREMVRAFKAIGFKGECDTDQKSFTDRYVAAERTSYRVIGIPVTRCLFQNKRAKKTEISAVTAMLIEGKLHRIEPSLPDGLKMDDVAPKLESTLGPPTWTGQLTSKVEQVFGTNTTTHRATGWEDAETAVILFESGDAYMSYNDLSLSHQISVLQQQQLNRKQAAAEKERVKKVSDVEF
jgi:hypothetical protein